MAKKKPVRQELFRAEVYEEQGNKIFSDTLIYNPPSFTIVGVFFSALFLTFFAILTLGTYRRSVTLNGKLAKIETLTSPEFEGQFTVSAEIASGIEVGQTVILELIPSEGTPPSLLRPIESTIATISHPPGTTDDPEELGVHTVGKAKIKVQIDPKAMGNRLVQKMLKDGTPLKASVITGEDSLFSFITRSLSPGEGGAEGGYTSR